MALGTVVKAVIFGIDPSSRKLAVVHGEPGEKHLGYEVKTLLARRPDACLVAFEWVGALVDRYPFHHPYVMRLSSTSPITVFVPEGRVKLTSVFPLAFVITPDWSLGPIRRHWPSM